MSGVIFKAIREEADIQRKLIEAIHSNLHFTFKNPDGEEFHFSPKIEGHLSLVFSRNPSHTNLEENQLYRINFNINDERYWAEATLHHKEHNEWTFNISTLFYSQKRKHHRYNIPDGYPAQMLFHTINNERVSHRLTLVDLSTEGCALSINLADTNMHLTDLIKGTIFISNETPLEISGLIKNIREKDPLNLIVGIEFLSSKNDFKILSLLSSIQRDLYFNKKAA